MRIDKRTKGPLPSAGPFKAQVVNNLDPSYMGRLEVALLKGIPNNPYAANESFIVDYLNPFYGVTSVRYEGNNPGDFNDCQKSYGWWAIPPDIGTTVMVIFVEGDPNQGFWMGCIQDEFQNHMVPGIAASRMVSMTTEQRNRYGVDVLPVGEFNKKTQTLENPNPLRFNKPVHPFADRLLAQGLLADKIRGVTTSGARREVPSSVFGISTPGRLDKTGKTDFVRYQDKTSTTKVPVSRSAGSSFVMDDGDVDGQNDLVRIRTGTGHQILMHNTKKLIYIANSEGTTWIELTSNGKIDIYAADSVSIHSESDFNFKADGNINIESGGNLNISAGRDLHIDTSNDFIINSSNNGICTFGSGLDIFSQGDSNIESAASLHLKGDSLYLGSVSGDTNIVSGANMLQTASSDFNINAGGGYKETAARIDMNGPTADKGTPPSSSDKSSKLPIYALSNRSVAAGWAGGKFYKAADIPSIMQRVPTHEPWDYHEDIDNSTSVVSNSSTKFTVSYNAGPAAAPPATTGNVENDNIAAFLWTIRACEGTATPNGYNIMFTGKTFSDFSKHPNIVNKSGKYKSTAAGAYQIKYSTWLECQAALNLKDFSPANQDKAAIYLIQRRGALDYVKSGDAIKAAKKCSQEWASLPTSSYGQPTKTTQYVASIFKKSGGTLA